MGEDSAVLGRLLSDNTVLNKGTDDELVCYGYCDNTCKKFLFYVLVFLTFGLVLLLLYWKPELNCYLKKSRCALYKADTVLLKDLYAQKHIAPVKSFSFQEEIREISDAYNRDEQHPENFLDSDDVAKLTVKQEEPSARYFDSQHVRYIWDNKLKSFARLQDLSSNTKCADLHDNYHGLSSQQQAEKRIVYGENTINVDVKSYWRLFIEEVLNPFYIFQIASITLWSLDDYYYYAACILLISCISIGISLYETKKQMITLHNMVATQISHLQVSRGDGMYEEVDTTSLVPGDVIVVPSHGCTLTCDAVLMAGTCILNESMLTGESVPVTKTPLSQQEDEEIYSPEGHKRHTLFAGTKVVQTRYYGQAKVLAVVVRTGFNTAKGELVRAILFPKPLGFKFYQDAMKFILFLACVAVFGMAYSVYSYVRLKADIERIIMRVLDIITIIVPPALPAAMTVGTVYAQSRLKKKQIFCISPPRINFCGRLNLFCFDKTGTLTEDGLDMWGVVPSEDNRFTHVVHDPSLLDRGSFLIGMVTCHSLTIIDGEISGDPLDLIMFKSTKWVLDEPGRDTSKFDTIMPTVVRPVTRETFTVSEDIAASNYEVGIVRQFTFSSSLQRMSVITRNLMNPHMEVYCKGAPEKIVSLCNPETVPEEFHEVLHQYTIQGFRVIALAWRPLDQKITWHQVQRLSRDKVECGLHFLGLIIMENKLKRQTRPVIRTLRAANIRSVMVTGDMAKTAISVARNCGMVGAKDQVIIVHGHAPDRDGPARLEWEQAETPQEETPEQSDHESGDVKYAQYHYSAVQQVSARIDIDPGQTHLAVSGKTFSVLHTYFPELLPKVCVQGTIFARMLPDQKCQLIEKLQEIGYSVGMCGDGANDCEALKAAHAGISLSEAEASVAAPFTSTVNNIECVVTLMREGRAALVTSFGCFKYMALYSFIQFISVIILYTYGTNLGDMQFLYIDLIITTTVAVLMGYTQAYDKLVSAQPQGSLVKPSNILSILLQVLCSAVFQTAAILYLRGQSWYTKVRPTHDFSETQCWETTVIFIVSSYQYIVVAFCYSRGPPFRKPIYTNIPYIISLVFLAAFSTVLCLLPWKPMQDFFTLERLDQKPMIFRGLLLAIVGAHFIAAVLIEYLVTENQLVKACIKRCKKKETKTQYKKIKKELEKSDWPPVGQVTYMSANHDAENSDTQVYIDNTPLDASINLS